MSSFSVIFFVLIGIPVVLAVLIELHIVRKRRKERAIAQRPKSR